MPRFPIVLIAALLLIYAVLARSAVRTKSPTSDEPYHALAGWMHLHFGNYLLDSEDPPLWSTYAALPNGRRSITADPDSLDPTNAPLNTDTEYAWQVRTLFRTPGNDADAFVGRSRDMMLLIAALLGAVIALWTWRLARFLSFSPARAAFAAVAATALFCFDPNFLGHGSLVKNDVIASLALLLLAMAVWAIGLRMTWPRLAALGLACGLALTVKFSGVLLVLIAMFLLTVRIAIAHPWSALGRIRLTWPQRFMAAVTAGVFAALLSWIIIWLAYDLRFTATSDPHSLMDLRPMYGLILRHKWQLAHTDGSSLPKPTPQDLAPLAPPRFLALVQLADQHHLLPQAWLAGFLFTYATAMVRATFLCGKLSYVGWWWYFPFAMLVKTPLATLMAALLAAIVAASRIRSVRRFENLWPMLCLILPMLLYLSAAMSSNLNLGLRHVLPIYPLAFIGIGLALARICQWRPRLGVQIGLVLALGLIAESLRAYPNYIAFFNVAAGQSRGGLRLLSDSNLDWGQDLKLLADWQRRHPDVKLYLAYFGTADPEYYGIRYTNIPDGYWAGPPPQQITSPGVIAISATTLQGPYAARINGECIYSRLWSLRPIEVLGGSIYLFRYPARPEDYLPADQRLINPGRAAPESTPPLPAAD